MTVAGLGNRFPNSRLPETKRALSSNTTHSFNPAWHLRPRWCHSHLAPPSQKGCSSFLASVLLLSDLPLHLSLSYHQIPVHTCTVWFASPPRICTPGGPATRTGWLPSGLQSERTSPCTYPLGLDSSLAAMSVVSACLAFSPYASGPHRAQPRLGGQFVV